MGKKIFHCGAIGSGQAMKLCNQILCAVNMVAVSEAFALADAMDIDKKAVIESLSAGAGGSWALTNLGPRIAKGDFAPGFTLDHMLKDLRLVSENTGPDTLLPGTQLAIDLFKKARWLGKAKRWATRNSSDVSSLRKTCESFRDEFQHLIKLAARFLNLRD